MTLELSDDEENVSSGSKDNVYIPDPSSEDSRISEDLNNTFDSSHRLSFLSLPDLNRNSQKKRQLNFSELLDVRFKLSFCGLIHTLKFSF